MRTLIVSTAFLFASAAAAPAIAASEQGFQQYGQNAGVVRCESNDGRRNRCATPGGRVVLERQHSSTTCIEGRNWGQDRSSVWVDDGCRADFRVVGYYGGNYGGGYGSSGQLIRCESNDDRYRQCAMNTNGGVQLVRTLSSSACIEGRSWGSNRSGVWVSQGCRAEFRSGGGNYGNRGNGRDGGQLIRCESNNDRTQRCPVDTRGGVQLVRKLSSSACIQGRDWNYDRNGIWVTDGCRAEFSVGGGRGNGYGNGGYGNNYGIGGQVFRCESQDDRRRECAANTRAGVQLVRQLSSSPCIQGRSWGYGRNSVWVTQGCRAEFRSH